MNSSNSANRLSHSKRCQLEAEARCLNQRSIALTIRRLLLGIGNVAFWHWFPFLVFITLALAFLFLMNRTVLGRHLYAMGGNEQAAPLGRIRTDRLKWFAYCVGAMNAALAGVLYTAEVGQADPFTEGSGYELNAIAAAVVGGCSLQGGIGTIPGVMLGVLFLRVVIDSVAKLVGSGSRRL